MHLNKAEHYDRELISVENPDTTRPFPQWLQVVYFIMSIIMILAGIIVCVLYIPNKAGTPDPTQNSNPMGMGGNSPYAKN